MSFDYAEFSKSVKDENEMKLNHLISLIIVIFNVNLTFGQNLPIDKNTGEVVYTDLVKFDTLTADTAFAKMLNYITSNSLRNQNIQIDTSKLVIEFTFTSDSYSRFPETFGKIESDVVIRYFPNKFAYRITNFRHIPINNYPPCSNNLKVIRPKCYEGKPYEKYWAKVKICAARSMNDYILKLLLITLENQPTKETLKMNDYFLVGKKN